MDTQVADQLYGALVNERYRVRARLARRDASTVYAATDERLHRPVLVRLADRGSPAGGGESLAARLVHPNVVAVYDEGQHDGVRYLVTEHVRARTLRELLAMRQRLTPAEALAVLEQMLAGLAAAHRAGITHGDVTPDRIMVIESPSGGTANLVDSVVKVDDFSLLRRDGDGDGPTATAAYVAPELVTDGHADARSDVYSAGIVLFEMLTGATPYHAATPAEVAWQHVDRDVPPPSHHAAGIPPALDDLVVRATRRDPAARPTDAGALLAEVQSVRDRVMAPAAPSPADDTVVISRVGAAERPPWARLPAGGDARRAVRWAHAARRGRSLPSPRVLIAAGTAVAVLLAVGVWWFAVGRGVPVPDLLRLSEQEAVAEAEQLGLTVEFADPQHSDEVPVGHVLAQDPPGDGRMDRGGTLMLTLSLGPEVLLVPDVVGARAEVARRQIESVGLVWSEGDPAYSDTVPEGRVVAVEPAEGTEMEPGDPVVVTLSRGRAPIQVPSVVGLPLNQASNALQQAGLSANAVQVESTRPAGEVVNQDPAAGSGVESGATVTLEVSEGPPTVPVPNVTGARCNQAEQLLTQQGFKVRREGGGRVVVQVPSAGTGLPPGSEVQILCAG